MHIAHIAIRLHDTVNNVVQPGFCGPIFTGPHFGAIIWMHGLIESRHTRCKAARLIAKNTVDFIRPIQFTTA